VQNICGEVVPLSVKAESSSKIDGVSIIASTKRAEYIHNLFDNFHRQHYPNKELIVIVHKDSIPIDMYLQMARSNSQISVYRIPEKISLGRCLNFGVKKAKYKVVAKFDDDDYYAPLYLKDSIRTMKKTKAHVVGKKAHYMWLMGKKLLILRYPKRENDWATVLPGATLVIRKSVFKHVKFSNISRGEDDRFCRKCKAHGFKLYSGSKTNFAALRRKYSKNHTWIISEKKLLSHKVKKIRNISDYKTYVSEA
jgi:cellulose synthase/poly-beta-1,6-N-acetylglucosamine synthase-like glycosyltransferase